MLRIIAIFLAGGCGCLLRYGVTAWVQRLGSGSFPIGTFTVNVVGCLAIGFLTPLFAGPLPIREAYRLAILVGLLGGFTTFSTYGYETFSLTTNGHFALAALNLLLCNALGLTAAWGGTRVAVAMYGP